MIINEGANFMKDKVANIKVTNIFKSKNEGDFTKIFNKKWAKIISNLNYAHCK